MKKQKLELNKKLVLNKKSIAALNSTEMGQIQGGLRNITNGGCVYSDLRCVKSTGDGDTCLTFRSC